MFYIIIIALLGLYLLTLRFTIPKGMTLFVGVPGSGKTTLVARTKQLHDKSKKKRNHKYGENFYCNVPIIGALNISPYDDFGKHTIENGVICVDESGVVFNNRNFNQLAKQSNIIPFAKYYRHYGIKSFMLFSQGMDIDVTFVRLADRIAIVTKSIFPFFICIRYAKKKVGIDEISHQLVDMYEWKPFGRKYIFAPTCWKLFDTYEKPFELTSIQFPVFGA